MFAVLRPTHYAAPYPSPNAPPLFQPLTQVTAPSKAFAQFERVSSGLEQRLEHALPAATPLLPPVPRRKSMAAALRGAWNQKVGRASWIAQNVRHRPTPAPPKATPTAVATMRLHLALDEHQRLRPAVASGTPQGPVAQALYEHAQTLRDDLVYARHLVQETPAAIERAARAVLEPVQTLLAGGPQAQALAQDIKTGVRLLFNDFDAVAATLGQAIAREQDEITRLKERGQLNEAAQRELDLIVNALALAAPGVGLLWGSGRAALAAGQVARVVAQTPRAQASLDRLAHAALRTRAGFKKSVKVGTAVTAATVVGISGYQGEAIKVYYDRRSAPRSGTQTPIPTLLYGAPRDVHAVTVKMGPLTASLWGGTGVTVGNPIGTAEARRAGKRRRAQNQVVNEQHHSAVVLGGGVRFGNESFAPYASRMVQLFNTTTTARADPKAERHGPTRLATQADMSWMYWNSTDALAVGPIALKSRKTKKGKSAGGTVANDGRRGWGASDARESKYLTGSANPAFGQSPWANIRPVLTLDPVGALQRAVRGKNATRIPHSHE